MSEDTRTLIQQLRALERRVTELERRDNGLLPTGYFLPAGDDFYIDDQPLAWSRAVAAGLVLPGVRGFWPMSSFNESGNAYDLSGQGRHLSYNGNPTYRWSGLIPYLDFDGAGDYLSRADESGLDIVGTEGYVGGFAQGLTLGGWFRFDSGTPGADEYVMSKMGASGNYAYRLVHRTTGDVLFGISVDGTNWTQIDSVATTGTGWVFLAGRFDTGTEVAVFVNGETTTLASAAAGVFNGNGPFQISGFNGANGLMAGHASMCFLSTMQIPDEILTAMRQQTRGLFGV